MQIVIAIAVLAAILIGVPYLMWRSLVWARRSQSAAKESLGYAFQELDKHVARPSVEHKLESEAEVLEVDDKHGGE